MRVLRRCRIGTAANVDRTEVRLAANREWRAATKASRAAHRTLFALAEREPEPANRFGGRISATLHLPVVYRDTPQYVTSVPDRAPLGVLGDLSAGGQSFAEEGFLPKQPSSPTELHGAATIARSGSSCDRSIIASPTTRAF